MKNSSRKSDKIRLLMVIQNMEVGGAQKLVTDLIDGISDKIDVSLLIFHRNDSPYLDHLESRGIKIIDLCIQNEHNLKIVFELIKHFKQYDIIHAHLFPTLYWCALTSIFTKSKLIYTEHSTDNRRRSNKILRTIERFIYSRYDKIACISQGVRNNLIDWLGKRFEPRTEIIYNGVKTKDFEIADKSGVEKEPVILMIGRFAPAKDQKTLIGAMKYVDEARLWLAGDGETLDECKAYAKENNLQDKVLFLGRRDDIPELISRTKIGVQSSKWEGFGLTAVEIMSNHKPIIATNVSGLCEIVEDAGILVKVGDSKEMADKINLLLKNPELYREFSDKCYQRAKQFDISAMNHSYLKLYEEVFEQ